MQNNGISDLNDRIRKKTVFHFLDYRQFLNALFAQYQLEDPTFSYRGFARLAESTSPNFLQLITSRTICITDRQADSIARNGNLRPKEIEFFKALIEFDHADSHSTKNEAFQRIVDLRKNRMVCRLVDNQYLYLSDWYNPVVRELLCSPNFTGDLQWVGDQMVPAIGLREVKRSVQLMEELGMIQTTNDGKSWQAVDAVVSTPSEVLSLAVIEYHREMLQRASCSLELFGADHRDIRSVTVGISKEKFAKLKTQLTAVWNEILEECQEEDSIELVVQLNMQLFPLTKIEDTK